MAKQFICDKCGDKFPFPIEEEKVKDIHGVWTVYDFCAQCKNKLEKNQSNAREEFIKK
jgi:hypothetical protein